MAPGGKAIFRISAWAAKKEAATITAAAAGSNKSVAIAKPTFTLGCPATTTCDLNPLPTSKPGTPNVEAEITVPKSAPSGDIVTFTATVTVDKDKHYASTGQATVKVTKPPSPTASPTPAKSTKPTTPKPPASSSPAPHRTTGPGGSHTTRHSGTGGTGTGGGGTGTGGGSTGTGGGSGHGTGHSSRTTYSRTSYSIGHGINPNSLPLINAGTAGLPGMGSLHSAAGHGINPASLPLINAGVGNLHSASGLPNAVGVSGLSGVPGTSTRIPAGSASNLFPKIKPSSVPNPAPRNPAAQPKRRLTDATAFPMSLGSSEFGAQVVGLIALLVAVAIAVTRISLRRSRPAAGKPGGTGQ